MNKLLILAVAIGISGPAEASITLPYQTSFIGCDSDQFFPAGVTTICGTDGTIQNTTYTAICNQSRVESAANFPAGAGERGWRRYICQAPAQKKSPASGTITITLNNEPEIWVRWYTRWGKGLTWTAGMWQKLVYIRPLGAGAVLDFSGPDGAFVLPQSGRGTASHGSNHHIYCNRDGSVTSAQCGWNTTNPTGTPSNRDGFNSSDDSWHAIEFHFKDQSGTGTHDGVWEMWIDNVLKWSVNGINWHKGAPTGVGSLQFMINSINSIAISPVYNDIDDIAISKKGHIGLCSENTHSVIGGK